MTKEASKRASPSPLIGEPQKQQKQQKTPKQNPNPKKTPPKPKKTTQTQKNTKNVEGGDNAEGGRCCDAEWASAGVQLKASTGFELDHHREQEQVDLSEEAADEEVTSHELRLGRATEEDETEGFGLSGPPSRWDYRKRK